jgi:ABC-2 type transport system permease protein
MPLWTYEWRLLLRSRAAVAGLILLAMLSSASVLSGLHFIAVQRANIAQVPALQDEDMAAVRDYVLRSEDAGSAAYYSFHPTWDAPSALAFAAIGMRDVSPYILRVRALGLEAQIHDSETYNPELALAGRFDYSFVLVFLAPLFVIALLYDLRSGEREAGRARMLAALPAPGQGVYLRRVVVRALALSLCLLLPFLAGALVSGVPVATTLAVVAISLGYLVFWIALSVGVGRLRWRPAAHATALAACWVVLALVAPTLTHVAINAAVPVEQGAEIAREQREAVNQAWDIPRQDTMRRFYAANPAWANSAPLGTAFHYKWYFAFHENGDRAVAPKVQAYRQGLQRREQLARRAAWLLPPAAVQVAMTSLARTDLHAQLAYQDRVRAYHAELRQFYYGYLFGERRFQRADFERVPRYSPAEPTAPPPA